MGSVVSKRSLTKKKDGLLPRAHHSHTKLIIKKLYRPPPPPFHYKTLSSSQVSSSTFPEKQEFTKPNIENMHDFCFTIPYGMLLIGGGFIGYMKKGSITSFAGGAVAGLLLILAGYLSLKAFEKKKNSSIAVVLQTGLVRVSLLVTVFLRFKMTFMFRKISTLHHMVPLLSWSIWYRHDFLFKRRE